MKLYNLTKVMGVAGVLIIVGSWTQWMHLHNDLSQFLFGLSVGVIGIGFAYVHNELKIAESERKENKKEDEEYRMSAEDMYTKLLTRVGNIEDKLEDLK